MSRNLRYNELDELDWEYKNYVPEDEPGDECWDEVCARMPDTELDDEDEEFIGGIFGNELNHAQNAKNEPSGVVSNGQIFGHGEKDDIIRAIFDLMAPCRDYHFEFKFFEAK